MNYETISNKSIEYKLQGLKSLENWILSCADEIDDVMIKDIGKGGLKNIPGTKRLFFRFMDGSGKRCSIHTLDDMDTLWNHFSETPVELFGEKVPHFHNYCRLLFHTRTKYLMVFLLWWYIIAVVIAMVAVKEYFNFFSVTLIISTPVLYLVFYGMYDSLYNIYRGNILKTEYLYGYVVGGGVGLIRVDEDTALANEMRLDIERQYSSSNSRIQARVYTKSDSNVPWKTLYRNLLSSGCHQMGSTYGVLNCYVFIHDTWMKCFGSKRIQEVISNSSVPSDNSPAISANQDDLSNNPYDHFNFFSTPELKAKQIQRDFGFDVLNSKTVGKKKLGFYQLLNICAKFFSLF
jgi:hypothetical protein